MNIVLVSEGSCYPPNSGSRLRIYHLMTRLARRHRITYLCRASGGPDEAWQARQHFAGLGIETVVVEDPVARQSGPLFYARLAANWFSPLPFSVTLHNSPGVHEAIRAHAANHRVDLWQIEWHPYLDAVPPGNGVRLLSTHDVVSLIWQRHYETAGNPLKRWVLKRQWRKFERFERRVYHAADRVLAVSEQDARTLRERFGVEHADVVDNGVDNAYYAGLTRPEHSEEILYLGALDSHPNRDALALLLDEVFPAVLRRRPSARLLLVGRNPPDWVRTKAQALPNTEVHANVADVRPYLARSAVLAVPLRIGGGSRVKILEAFAAGLPVVSTRVGAEGLDVQAGRELLLEDGVEEMARALVEVLQHPAAARDRADRARRLVGACYDWEALARKLELVWERCLQAHSPNSDRTRPWTNPAPTAPAAP
jgi:glycosyltransferase involved in cell wall biosynthesis